MSSQAASTLVAQVTLGLREGKKEPVAVAPELVPALEKHLARFFGSAELVDVVEELCLFAIWLGDEKRSPSARDRLLEVARTALPELERLGAKKAQKLAEDLRRSDYSRLTGYRQAGLSKGEAPEGSVPTNPFARFELAKKGLGENGEAKPKKQKAGASKKKRRR